MSKGLVLVIDDDEWVGRLLSVAMREAGYEVLQTESASDGFFRAVEQQPACIVCDVDLPDQKGFWVARRIRSHPSKVSMAPFVFLSGLDDRDSRLEGFQVGADAYITKPFRIDEVVAQVEALIQMAQRLQRNRKSLLSIPPASAAAMSGNLAHLSIATVLTLLDLERRSGRLDVFSKQHRADVEIVAGGVIASQLDGGQIAPLALLRVMLGWEEGRFEFHPSSATEMPDDALLLNGLLMEAARLEDEARSEDGEPRSEDRPSMLSQVETLAREVVRSGGSGIANSTPSPPDSRRAEPSSLPPDSKGPISIVPDSAPPSVPSASPRNVMPPPAPTLGSATARGPKLPLPPRGSTGFAPALRTRSSPPASVRPGLRPSAAPAAQKPDASATTTGTKPNASTKPASFLSTVTPSVATKVTDQPAASTDADTLETGWSEPPPSPGAKSGED
jgi:two-component system, OmpR family, response regulator